MTAFPVTVALREQNTSFQPGAGLPTITSAGVSLPDQTTLDAVLLAAGKAGVELRVTAGGGTPVVAAAAQKLMDAQAVVGAKERALRRYHYALGARDAEPLDVMFACGDSLFSSAGVSTYANTLAQKFAKYHRAAHPQAAAGGLGLINPSLFGSSAVGIFPDAPISYTPTGTYSPGTANGPGWGLSSATNWLGGAGKSTSFTFTGTGCDLSWLSTAGVGGSATLTVDGTVYGAYNAGTKALTAGAGTIAAAASSPTTLAHGKIRGLAAGSHTVTWTWATGLFFHNECFAYNGDDASGCRVAVQAYPGRGTRNYIGTSKGAPSASNPYPAGGQAEQWRQHIRDGSYLPDAVILDNFANDYAGISADLCSPTENLANLQAIIAAIKADVIVGAAAAGVASYIPSFVIAPCHCIVTSNIGGPSGNGGTMVDYWQSYVANAYAIAANDPDGAAVVFDLGQRLQGVSNTWDDSTYQGLLWTDRVHTSDAGTDWWARSLVEFIRPA